MTRRSCAAANAFAAVADPDGTRTGMVSLYAACLRAEGAAILTGRRRAVSFAALDRAIAERWPRGLEWIRQRAWEQLIAAAG